MIAKLFATTILAVGIATTASAQSRAEIVCDNNIEYLRQDLVSMLNKIPAIPTITGMYTAAREKFEELKVMQRRGQYYECAVEGERVTRITRPYGNRY